MIAGLNIIILLLIIFEECKTAPYSSPQVSIADARPAGHSRIPSGNGSTDLTAIDQGFIVVAGGCGIDNAKSDKVHFLDIANRKWVTIGPLPVPDEGSAMFFANDKIFSAAGFANGAAFLVYNTSYFTWQLLPDLARPAGWGACAAALNGNIHLIGGQTHQSSTQVLNIQAGLTWTEGARLHQPHYECGAATLDGYIYVCGHRSEGGDGQTCEKYDPSSNSWSFISSMLDYHEGQILVALGGYLYAVGGNTMGSAEKYDPSTDKWTAVSSMSNTNRTFSAAATDGALIYVLGGCAGSNECHHDMTDSVEVYVPELDQWTDGPSMPAPLKDAGVLFVPNL